MGDFIGWFTGSKKSTKGKSLKPSIQRPGAKAVPGTKPAAKVQITEISGSTGKRKLSKIVILFILINSILGSSLFYLPGLGVISSGAASIIAWAILFTVATFMMMYMGELITLHPTSGGTYEFCKRAYGRFGSFLAGWLIWLAGNFGMALAVVAAAEYFIPETSEAAFVLRMIFVGMWIIILGFMAYRGIDAGATMLVAFGAISLVVVILMIVPSFIDFPALFTGTFQSPFDISFFKPFFRHSNTSIISYLGLSLLLISEAFLGFEALSYMANEAEEPHKLHKILILAMVLCGGIMFIYILSSLGTVSYHDYVTNARPFIVQALNTVGEKGTDFVLFGMYLVIVGTAAAWPITGSRLLQAMARDKLFVQNLAVLHPTLKSPYRAVIFQTVIVFLFSWLIFRGYRVGWKDPYGTIYLIFVLLSILVISMVVLTVPILRRKEKDLQRPYTAPLGTIGPILLVVFFLVLIGNWIFLETGKAITILKLTGSLIFVGFPFYFMVEMFYNPKAITEMNEKLSYFVLLGEKLFFPFGIKKKLLQDMGDIKGKSILEYGCSVGTLTKKLAEMVGPTGRIIATDLSLNKVKMTDKRTKQHAHVTVHHHPHLHDFKLPVTQKVDGVLSIGQLSYMQNPQQILTSVSKHVNKGGEIVFLDYDKFFYIIPNVKWMSGDQQLKEMFAKAGFSVEVERKRGLLWQYVIVYGVKT